MGIARWPEGDRASGPGGHGVVMLFVRLHVGAKFQLGMLGEIDVRSMHDRPWTESRGDAIVGWEAVQPKNTEIDQLDEHATGDFLEWQHSIHTTDTLLDGPDLSLDFGYMFSACDSVEGDPEIGEVAAYDIELPVHQHDRDPKSAFHIDSLNAFHVLNHGCLFLIQH